MIKRLILVAIAILGFVQGANKEEWKKRTIY